MNAKHIRKYTNDLSPGQFSVYVDEEEIVKDTNHSLAWSRFMIQCRRYDLVGKTILLKKNEKVVAHQKVK